MFYPGGAPQFEYTAVNVKDRSHTITAHVDIPDGGAEGVLLAHGSWFAGYSLYVKDGRLVYVHNCMGLAEYRIESTAAVPAGKHTLAFDFTRTGPHRGRGTLLIDGQPVGEGDIPRTVPHVIETSGEGLCCGYDSGLPVTPDYRAPFRFTGRIDQVVVELDDDGVRNRRRSAVAQRADRPMRTREGFMQRLLTLLALGAILALPLARGGAAVSGQAHPLHRAVSARGQHRHRRAHLRAEALGAAGAVPW